MSAAATPASTRAPSPAVVWAALVTVYVVWGSTYLAIRFAVETLPPFLMAAVRFLIAGGMMYLWARWRGAGAPTRREWAVAAVAGVFMLVGGNGGVVWAQQRVASGPAALIVATAPLWMVLIDGLRPGGWWPGRRALAGVLVGFAGAAVLIDPFRLANGTAPVDPVGGAVLVLAAFLWSVGSLYHRSARVPTPPLLSTAMAMLGGGAGLLLLGLLTGEPWRLSPEAITARSLWALGYLIVFGSWVGFTAYIWLLRVAPTPLVSTYAFVNPMVAVWLGYLLAGEAVSPRTLVATAAIVGSVALTTRARSGAAPRPQAREAGPAPAAASVPR